jgi:putative spermidine/putrescine transport system permease protein
MVDHIVSRLVRHAWQALIFGLYLFLLAPIIVVFITSFDTRPYLAFPPEHYSLASYGQLLKNTAFIRAFGVSLGVGGVAAVLAIFSGILAALAIVRGSFRGRTFVNWLFISPLLVPHIVLGLALLLLLSRLQMLDTYTGVVFAHIGITLPYVVRTVAISLQGVDPRLEEAARVHGASPIKAFWLVTIPAIRPGIVTGAIIAFLVSFDEAVVSLFIVNTRVSTLPVEIYHYIEYRTDPQVAALSVVLVLISVLLVSVVERLYGLRKALN